MDFKAYLLVIQYLILCYKYDVVSGKPMIGQNVRYAENNEFNYVVSVMKRGQRNLDPERDFLCTGTLISKKDVLTVEHCFQFVTVEFSEIHVGSIDSRQGSVIYPTRLISFFMWATHRRKRITQRHDIAIVKLRNEVPDNIIPAPLSQLRHNQLTGLDVVAVGWGKQANDRISVNMETVTFRVLSNNECIRELQRFHVPITTLDRKHICTSAEPFAFLCEGNSGSPILYDGALVAIHEGTCPYTENPNDPNKVNLNLSTDYYRNYITDVIQHF